MLSVKLVNVLSAIDFSAAVQFVDTQVHRSRYLRMTGDPEKSSIRSIFPPQCLPISLVWRLRSLSTFQSSRTHRKLMGEGSYEDTWGKCTLTVTWQNTSYFGNEILDTLADYYPLASVTSLTVSPYDDSAWSGHAFLLSHCRSITQLSIRFGTDKEAQTINLEVFCYFAVALVGHMLP